MTETEPTCLVLHRKSANRPEVMAAVKAVKKVGIPLRVRVAWNKKDKPRVVREAVAAGASRIIAGGGDGTINAVVDALVGDAQGPPLAELGVLPLGTANDFAHGLGLPVKDLAECLRLACTLPSRAIDVGRLNRRSFINVASLGFGAEVTASTPLPLKKALGGGAYTLMGLATAVKFTPYSGTITVPGRDPIRGAMIIGGVGNNRFAGGGFDVAPKASLTDGLLDLSLVTHDESFTLFKVMEEMQNPFGEGNQYLVYRQMAEFTLHWDQKLQCNLDGEPVRKKTMGFSVLPQWLPLAMPEESASS